MRLLLCLRLCPNSSRPERPESSRERDICRSKVSMGRLQSGGGSRRYWFIGEWIYSEYEGSSWVVDGGGRMGGGRQGFRSGEPRAWNLRFFERSMYTKSLTSIHPNPPCHRSGISWAWFWTLPDGRTPDAQAWSSRWTKTTNTPRSPPTTATHTSLMKTLIGHGNKNIVSDVQISEREMSNSYERSCASWGFRMKCLQDYRLYANQTHTQRVHIKTFGFLLNSSM